MWEMRIIDLVWRRGLGATVVLLLFADVLTFHDLVEPHTVKDWLVLAASVLAVGAWRHEIREPADDIPVHVEEADLRRVQEQIHSFVLVHAAV